MDRYKTETNNNDYGTLRLLQWTCTKVKWKQRRWFAAATLWGTRSLAPSPSSCRVQRSEGVPARPAGGGVWAWCAVKQGKIRQIFGQIFQQAVLSDMCTDVQQQSSCEEILSMQGQCCNPVSNFSGNLAICDMMGVVKNRCPILSLFCLRPPYIYIWSNWSIAPKWPQHHVGLFQAKAETFPN